MDYFFLYLTFPSTITLSLVNVDSQVKCPGMRGFIASNDYEKYKKQKDELEPYYAELILKIHFIMKMCLQMKI